MSNLIRAVGLSHFLSDLTVRIDVSRLDQTQRASFRTNTILRALSQIRNVQHLVIDLSEPWPDLEAWLRAHMTVPRTPGVNGEHWMPAMLSHMPRASRVGRAWSVRDHDRWALALGVNRPNSGVHDRAIRRLARDFTRRDRAQAQLLNASKSRSSVIQYQAVMVAIPAHLLHLVQPPTTANQLPPPTNGSLRGGTSLAPPTAAARSHSGLVFATGVKRKDRGPLEEECEKKVPRKE
jgi:hypothetical protein